MKKKALIFLILLLGFVCIHPTIAEVLKDGDEVKANTELIYYLDVTYDGVDVNGVESEDGTLSSVYSDYIYIEDKLPEGLKFTGFQSSADGSIGAVSRSDPNEACLGYVVGGVDGLDYNSATRTVSFTVKNLQAGCKLTVGIKTLTPTLEELGTQVRKDFYNTATAKENDKTENSNTVHVWVGEEAVELYPVVYKYEAGSPTNAPEVPPISSYSKDSVVGVEKAPVLEGYKFNGWKTSDVSVSDSKFTMPGKTVTFTGSFTKLPTYEVSYEISGTTPEGYILPTTKSYYENTVVKVDVLKEGDIINGYRFLGWQTTDGVSINSEKEFTMPAKNVHFVGKFEEITYKVEYKFQGSIMPSNAESLLPEVKRYKPGATVKLAADPVSNDYRFLGWYYKEEFTMPEEDVVIYGEWAEKINLYDLTITKTIPSGKKSYQKGEKVNYEIVVKNSNSFAVTNVVVQEQNENARFVANSAYTLETDHLVTIPRIGANSSVVVYATYDVEEKDSGIVTNTVQIIGATADRNMLNPDKEYKAETTFNVKEPVRICKKVEGKETIETFRIKIWNDNYESYVLLKAGECQDIYLDTGSYKIRETVPKEYELTITGPVTENGATFKVETGKTYNFNFTNRYEAKGFFQTFGRIVNKIEAIVG